MPAPGVTIPLTGPAGEPVDLRRTLCWAWADLPPLRLDEAVPELTVTLAVRRGRPRTVTVRPGSPGQAQLCVVGRAPAASTTAELVTVIRSMLRLDEDLSAFYTVAGGDPDLSWVVSGAGRLTRSPTVFEDVVKTVCSTNCHWSATRRMVTALVEHLGEPAADGSGRAFPTPAAMAEVGEGFYREVARAGYRGRSLREIARRVADGEIDLEELARPGAVADTEATARLESLPGVGPYAAAHVALMLGHYAQLILDSWTRPTYARLVGRTQVADRTIRRRFAGYGSWAGLAFWLYLTRDGVHEEPAPRD